jgi:hypothetical protein
MPAHAEPETKPLAEALVGTWELVSRTDRAASGEIRQEPSLGSDPVALVYYDRSGRFAAQFMKRDRSSVVEVAAAGPNNSRARGGYDAYFGAYAVQADNKSVAHRLLAALSNENVGQVFTRTLEVVGDTLTIRLETATAEGEPVTRTLVWTRVA